MTWRSTRVMSSVCHSPMGFSAATVGHDTAVDGAHVVRVDRSAVALEHLDFIDAAQVDPAVAVLQRACLEGEIEVLELSFGADIRVSPAWFAFFMVGPVDEHAVFDAPPHGCVGAQRLPAGQVLAVEERNGLAELHLGQVGRRRQGRSAFARELRPAEFAAVGSGLDGDEFQVVARPSSP